MPRNANRYRKTSNQVNLVLYQINGICSARTPCLAMLNFIGKLRIPLMWYYIKLTGFVARGPRASQCLTLSENFESR